MTIRPLLTLALLVALPPVGRSAPAATESSAQPKPAAPAGIAALAELKPGLPAKAVRKLLGEPREVRPMKAPDGKAEVWVYTRELGTHIVRIEFPGPEIITYVIGGDGKPIEQKTAGPSRYENVQHVTEERVEVLMFNDQYVVHKTSRNERQIH
ncbi:MAG: hypothetical protein WCR49_06390 [Opitutae bacterium]